MCVPRYPLFYKIEISETRRLTFAALGTCRFQSASATACLGNSSPALGTRILYASQRHADTHLLLVATPRSLAEFGCVDIADVGQKKRYGLVLGIKSRTRGSHPRQHEKGHATSLTKTGRCDRSGTKDSRWFRPVPRDSRRLT